MTMFDVAALNSFHTSRSVTKSEMGMWDLGLKDMGHGPDTRTRDKECENIGTRGHGT